MHKRTSAGACGADVLSCDAPSTSYPTTSLEEDWDMLGACMTTAQEMEACVDAVVSVLVAWVAERDNIAGGPCLCNA